MYMAKRKEIEVALKQHAEKEASNKTFISEKLKVYRVFYKGETYLVEDQEDILAFWKPTNIILDIDDLFPELAHKD